MWRTGFLVLVITLMAYHAGAWLTQDYRVWTSEGARRLLVAQAPVAAPDIAMIRSDGAVRRLPNLLRARGAITVVDFVYTRCPTVCLALGSVFQQMQAELAADDTPAAARIRLLSISFDPAHDTPAALSAYSQTQRADPGRWQWAVPARAVELDRLLRAFGVVVIPDGLGGYTHNAGLLVIDHDGRLVRVFDPTEMSSALTFARRLAAAESVS